MLYELSETSLQLPADDLFVPYWQPEQCVLRVATASCLFAQTIVAVLLWIGRITAVAYAVHLSRYRVPLATFLAQDSEDNDAPTADTAENRLRWMLKHTMGSPCAFEGPSRPSPPSRAYPAPRAHATGPLVWSAGAQSDSCCLCATVAQAADASLRSCASIRTRQSK